jgi:hypothetical protein
LPIEVGGIHLLCIGRFVFSHKPGAENECSMLFKARVVGTIKRMPGLYDISGYKPAAYMNPGVVITESQMKYIIDKFT